MDHDLRDSLADSLADSPADSLEDLDFSRILPGESGDVDQDNLLEMDFNAVQYRRMKLADGKKRVAAMVLQMVADEKASRRASGWGCCWNKTKGQTNRTPLSVALISGERMQHTDAGWEFLALQDQEITEVGQVMRVNNISLFIEGAEDQVNPSMLLKDLDPNKPLFALPDAEAATRLHRQCYMTRAEAALQDKMDRADTRRRRRRECCDTIKEGGADIGSLLVIMCVWGSPLAWLVMGIFYAVDSWESYRSGELEGTCPSSHLYEACLTELAFAGVGIGLCFIHYRQRRKHYRRQRRKLTTLVALFAFFALLAWLWTVVEIGIARSHCPSIGESNLWIWAIVTVIGWGLPVCLLGFLIATGAIGS
jgi:hypothetical protein